jgi:hypothetical protein
MQGVGIILCYLVWYLCTFFIKVYCSDKISDFMIFAVIYFIFFISNNSLNVLLIYA